MGKQKARRGNITYKLFHPETDQGWRVIHYVSFRAGETKCARGEWREVLDTHGNRIGYQVLASFLRDEELPSRQTSASVTVRECELNAGLGGRSRTAGMLEEDRISRKTKFGKALPPEDAIERAREKVKEFGRNRLVAAPRVAEIASQGNWEAFPGLASVAAD